MSRHGRVQVLSASEDLSVGVQRPFVQGASEATPQVARRLRRADQGPRRPDLMGPQGTLWIPKDLDVQMWEEMPEEQLGNPDELGLAPIHHAAQKGAVHIIERALQYNNQLMEQKTVDVGAVTPLLIAVIVSAAFQCSIIIVSINTNIIIIIIIIIIIFK